MTDCQQTAADLSKIQSAKIKIKYQSR